MSQYPDNLDDDTSLPRVDDNITEVGGDAINALRESTFAIEEELGTNPAGSASSVAERLDVALNPDGTLKDDALNQINVASYPIDNPQVADNAGIKESKLSLDYSTASLQAQINVLDNQLEVTTDLTQQNESKLNGHLQGSALLPDGSAGRHVLSHIDINNVPSDSRDVTFVWDGISNKDGDLRPNDNLAVLLEDINQSLVNHQNIDSEAHAASSISVDTSNFEEIPPDATDVQTALNYIDQAEVLNLGEHRATQHSNGIPQIARSNLIDQVNVIYSAPVVPETPVKTFLKHPPNFVPVDDLSIGDDLIQFFPDSNAGFIFDGYFSQVKVGDVITVTYDNGIQTTNYIDSLRYSPGVEFIVRINGYNLFDADGYGDGYVTARIDKARYDRNTAGVFAVAAANPTPSGSFSNLLGSVIVGSAKGATALGLGFNPSLIDNSHYNLYLELYPTGNPLDKIISLPAIDISGDLGVSPGNYNLESVIQATNNKLREIGYNYRFIVFEQQNEFGIMLADAINKASFAIISGNNSSGTLVTGSFTNNVIGGNSIDDIDPLGLGSLQANLASPSYLNSWIDANAAQLPTKVITPFQHRYAYVNGKKIDTFAQTYLAENDGYWTASIVSKTLIGIFTLETTYLVNLDLSPAELKSGKTIVVQPTLDFNNSNYSDSDYGRFIIKSVNFTPACGNDLGTTLITVINGVHGTADPIDYFPVINIDVKLYFGEDSISFNYDNIINQSPATLDYYRLHEIYLTEEGKTFSHERARMPRQTESSTLLGTNNWHLLDVSNKLRGYLDGDGSFNKYVRLYITNYDNTSGEFDGYLGQRDPLSDNIINPGELVHGKKNVPIKFYDETGIDYLELKFQDTVSAGIPILSTVVSRYVDIEIFPSLQLHDEIMCLAVCEVNWDPAANVDVVQHVKNKREFGSIKTDDLTQEAINYIAAPEKLLHHNGIINGIDLTDNTDLLISLQGGNVIIDGQILSINPATIKIPAIWQFGLSTPQTINWCLCLNSEGKYEFIIITSSKTQFFVTPDGIESYLLPSYTFHQLVNIANHLLPLYFVDVTVSAPSTFSSVSTTDIRKFVKQETNNIPLSIFGDELLGNFESFESGIAWLKKYSSTLDGQYQIYVKGAIEINTAIDLTDPLNTLIFIGDGSEITVNSAIGFNLGSNCHFKNLNFNYTKNLSSGDFVNSSEGGVFYISSVRDAENIEIQNCHFSSEISNVGPPFISFEMAQSRILDKIKIKDNFFVDINANSQQIAAIALINLNTGGTGIPPLISNTIISNNICNDYQGIYITSTNLGRYAPSATNCIIEKNQCGVIGYFLSEIENTNLSTGYNNPAGLIIQENTCRYIGNLGGDGYHVLSGASQYLFDYTTSNVIISKNYTHWIDNICYVFTTDDPGTRIKTIISDNILVAWNSAWKEQYVPDGYASGNIAIQVIDNLEEDTFNNFQAIISGNTTDYGFVGASTFNYTGIVLCFPSANIENNIFRGINGESTISMIDLYTEIDRVKHWIITGNQLYRNLVSILSYIKNGSGNSNFTSLKAIISNNTFDFNTVDGSNYNNIVYLPPDSWVITQNINHSYDLTIRGYSGVTTLPGGYTSNPSLTSLIQVFDSATQTVVFNYNDTGVSQGFTWVVSLNGLIPLGAKVKSVSVSLDATVNPTVSGTWVLTLRSDVASLTDSGSISTLGETLTIDASSSEIRILPNNNPVIIVTATISSASTTRVDVGDIHVVYQW